MFKITILSIFALILVQVSDSYATVHDDGRFIEEEIILKTATGNIYGSLVLPNAVGGSFPLVLLVSGSGPTDRDGNNSIMKNNSLKQLAENLAEHQIATVRFDKRGVARSAGSAVDESELRFDHYVNDVKAWVEMLVADKRFSKIMLAGHSEGALITLIAANEIPTQVKGYVSIAGAGSSADMILKEQLKNQPQAVIDLCFPMIDSLKKGSLIPDVPVSLYTLFRPSVQPYLVSWFKHDPRTEMEELQLPALIIQGDRDIQVSVQDAQNLKDVNPGASLVILSNVNHILKNIEGDDAANRASYNNPDLPVDPRVAAEIAAFVLK